MDAMKKGLAKCIASKLDRIFATEGTEIREIPSTLLWTEVKIWSKCLSPLIASADADDIVHSETLYEEEVESARTYVRRLRDDITLLEFAADRNPEEKFRIATLLGYLGSETTVAQQ
ncbi:hypothetical protein TUN199_10731 [Pyrenophora tritici-repentis]|uniref:Uncharacterized protein n=1 Tax=Pyrenophora tritici-repentis TaxID=45151 RepID=A0A317B959_9PLEO|nr:hypothetical protein PtrV1_12691 [Pyrenophora tritici-repentis]KAF7445503.1 hypothetical protein A1F99_104890 [Pyrenophora tritici-repentis]KAF7565785.1 hypothetical protein PtrM4_052190 [Pyrenophora tritici-repentis]KAI0583564.1 hypothetical protein Alg215_03531 [Pyrenophora tritici-repentis]KAI0617281.1 hypothetical protein TUN199_10731 [Pyrenophora tritici-repentis]